MQGTTLKYNFLLPSSKRSMQPMLFENAIFDNAALLAQIAPDRIITTAPDNHPTSSQAHLAP